MKFVNGIYICLGLTNSYTADRNKDVCIQGKINNSKRKNELAETDSITKKAQLTGSIETTNYKQNKYKKHSEQFL